MLLVCASVACSASEDVADPSGGGGLPGTGGDAGATNRDAGTAKDGGSFPIGGAGGMAGSAGSGAGGNAGTAGSGGGGGSTTTCPTTWSRDLPNFDTKASAQLGDVIFIVGDKAGDSHIAELSACDGSLIRDKSTPFGQGYSTFLDAVINSGSVYLSGSSGPPTTTGEGLYAKLDLTTLSPEWSQTVTPSSPPGTFHSVAALSESSLWLFGAAANGPWGGIGGPMSACDIGLSGAGSALAATSVGSSVYAAVHQDSATTLRRFKPVDCAGCTSCSDDWRSNALSTTGTTAARGLAIDGATAFIAGSQQGNAVGFLSQVDLANGAETSFFSEDTSTGIDGFTDVTTTATLVIAVGGADYTAVDPPAKHRGVIYAFTRNNGQLANPPVLNWQVERTELRLAVSVLIDDKNGGVIVGGNTYDSVSDSFSGKVIKCTETGQCP